MADARTASRLEAAIARLWREILQTDEVGLEDDFFSLGGDSLRAVEMLAAVDDLLLTAVDFPDFLDAPTVAGLAVAVERLRGRAEPAPAATLGDGEAGPPPATFAQERLWFLDQLAGPTGAYNMPLGTRIRGALDLTALERALREIVRRHNALRTTFTAVDGRPFLVVSDEPRLDLEQVDVSGEPDPEAAARRAVDEAVSLPFDLERGPLHRGLLLRLGEEDHVLELVFDHAICDGWSHVVIYEELATLYESYRRGSEPTLALPAVQYDDHARRERALLTDAVIEEKLAYWRERLAGIPAALELPTDRPRPPRPSHEGATLRTHLPEEAAERVRAFARTQGATPFTTLLAAFNVLLYRYSRAETIVVGTTSAARDRTEIRGTVGLFASTLALRADLSDALRFGELTTQVRDTVLEAVAHQDVPFERLVADLAPDRDASRQPIFQVFFAHVPRIPLAIAGAVPFDASPTKARVDLTLWIEEEADGFDVVWEYNTDIFDRSTVERLGRHYVRLLESGIDAPDTPIGELQLLDDGERTLVVDTWNSTTTEYPDLALHELFEAQVASTPDAVAVAFEDARLTYRELDDAANQLAHHLRGLGVTEGTLAAVYMERSVELVVALLSILKAGAAYVPVDPDYPAERVAFMIEDADAPVLLTQEHLLPRTPESKATIVCLERDARAISSQPSSKVQVSTTGESRAYVIYTSGSTGRPKGAANTHRGIVNRLLWMQSEYELDETDRILQKTPFGFDVSVWEFFWPLITGARLVMARPGGHRDPAYIVGVVERERITTMHFVPSMLASFVEFVQQLPGCCPTLRRVICSGEALNGELVGRFFECFQCELHNLYGPTEAAVDVTAWACRRSGEPGNVPIGRPIANTQIYILDDGCNPLPPGIPGELYIGGVQVAQGYLNRPELTADRFAKNPFHAGSMYRTGDLARWDDTGVIEYLGRLDDQVKIRGFRIELGEIDFVIGEQPGVASVATIVREDTVGDKRLVAYVVPERGATVDVDGLRNSLEARLPAFMVPSAFVPVDQLPLTPNGKLDRKALPAPVYDDHATYDFVAPTTDTEVEIAQIWCDILGLESVGVSDQFFRLGGHSLLAARVATKVRERFGIALSVRALFDHPVFGELAAHVDEKRAEAAPPAADVALVARNERTDSPLSSQQRQLLFLDDLSEGGATYNAALAYRVAGPINRDALRGAVALMVERHEALRTVLHLGEDVEQVVLRDWSIELEDVDAAGSNDTELLALLRELARRPFDLRSDLLLRTVLVQVGADDHVVLFQTHHIVFDAWAVEIFLRELSGAYAALVGGSKPDLPPLPFQYRDFAVWQHDTLTGARLEHEEDFWRRYLAGAPTFLPLAPGRARPDEDSVEAASFTFDLPREVAHGVRALCTAVDVTPYMVLLAVFSTLLYRETGQDDILLGGPSANRVRPEFDGIIGFFANTIVTRVELRGNPTFRELLGRVRRSVLEAIDHQELSLERVVDAVRPERRPGVNPLFQVNFRTQIGAPPTLDLPGTTSAAIPIDLGLARFDLALEAQLREDGIGVELLYATGLFERTRVERLAAIFEGLLRDALRDPDRRLLSFELPDEQASAQAVGSIRGSRRR